jgi:mannan endo-1,4-beta-mannosidase
MLDAPRSLSERGFREDSWVARALPVSDDAHLALPILPSLQRLAATHFPGTEVAVTEFNYGGAGQLAAGLAVADALGRFGAASIGLAAHWGSLDGWLNQAYRLFCDYGEGALTVELDQPSRLSAFAARSGGRNAMMHLIVINKAERETFAEVTLQTAPPAAEGRTYGFDAGQSLTGPIAETAMFEGTQARLRLPARSARHIVFG